MARERNLHYQRTLALAGVFQAANLAHNIAAEGKVDQVFFIASIASLLRATSDDLADVYGSLPNLKLGLDDLARFLKLDTPLPHSVYITRYTAQLLKLGGLLHRDSAMAAKIAYALGKLPRGAKSKIPFSLVETMADIYYENFSQLSSFQRIRIMGKKEHLSDGKNVSRIRAILLAGVRAAILWRNFGGNQLILLFGKRSLAIELTHIKEAMKKL